MIWEHLGPLAIIWDHMSSSRLTWDSPDSSWVIWDHLWIHFGSLGGTIWEETSEEMQVQGFGRVSGSSEGDNILTRL